MSDLIINMAIPVHTAKRIFEDALIRLADSQKYPHKYSQPHQKEFIRECHIVMQTMYRDHGHLAAKWAEQMGAKVIGPKKIIT